MQTKAVLGQADVIQVLDAAQQEADRNSWPVTIAVTDDGGHLLALRRLDGAAPFSAEVATQKRAAQRSAAKRRKSSRR